MWFKCFQFSDKHFLALEGLELEELEDSNSFKFLPVYITALRWPILFIPPCISMSPYTACQINAQIKYTKNAPEGGLACAKLYTICLPNTPRAITRKGANHG